MKAPPATNQLSQDQSRARDYVKANGGVTTRAAALALGRPRLSLLTTLNGLEARGVLRSHWPNRAGADSWEWYVVEGSPDA